MKTSIPTRSGRRIVAAMKTLGTTVAVLALTFAACGDDASGEGLNAAADTEVSAPDIQWVSKSGWCSNRRETTFQFNFEHTGSEGERRLRMRASGERARTYTLRPGDEFGAALQIPRRERVVVTFRSEGQLVKRAEVRGRRCAG